MSKDLDAIMLDYAPDCTVRLFSAGEFVTHKGADVIRSMFEGFFTKLDMSTMETKVADIEEDSGNGCGTVFLVWKCPGSDVELATDTFVFDKNFKIVSQTIVVIPSKRG